MPKRPRITATDMDEINKDIADIEHGKVEIFINNGEVDGYDVINRRRKKKTS